MSLFLIALDQTILASALPKIVTAFDALDSVTWVSGGYFEFAHNAAWRTQANSIRLFPYLNWVVQAATFCLKQPSCRHLGRSAHYMFPSKPQLRSTGQHN